jgi:hypothetical protein
VSLPAFDPLGLIGVLNEHGVRFVVIGGIAAGVQGVVWATTDLDICHGRTRKDYDALAEALVDLQARPAGVPVDVTVKLDPPALRRGDWWSFATRLGKLDCLGEPAPGIDYEFLAPRSRHIEGSHTYRVATLADIIAMKEEASRAKDRAHLELLRAAERLAGGSNPKPRR